MPKYIVGPTGYPYEWTINSPPGFGIQMNGLDYWIDFVIVLDNENLMAVKPRNSIT